MLFRSDSLRILLGLRLRRVGVRQAITLVIFEPIGIVPSWLIGWVLRTIERWRMVLSSNRPLIDRNAARALHRMRSIARLAQRLRIGCYIARCLEHGRSSGHVSSICVRPLMFLCGDLCPALLERAVQVRRYPDGRLVPGAFVRLCHGGCSTGI